MVEQERGKMIDDDGQPQISNGQADKPFLTAEYFRDNHIDIDDGNRAMLPYFGVWHMTIKEAAELVALDMWHSGEMPDIEEPEDWDGNEYDPKLLALLSGHTAIFETRLLAAVNAGRLEAAVKRRDFDERLIPEEIYIELQELEKWLDERGYQGGEIISDWNKSEQDAALHVCEELAYIRMANKSDRRDSVPSLALHGLLAKNGMIDEANVAEVVTAYKAIIIENQHLKERLAHAKAEQPAKVDRPLPTRQRRTLLTIIAALCKYSAIDPGGKGAAGQIAKLTEDIDANVTDETIAKVLAEIPDALETRMK